MISLNAPDFKARVSKISGTGKVPVLADGDVHVWESLAILEYLAEKFPDAGLWPSDPAARGSRAGGRLRDACRLRAAAPPPADEHVAAGHAAGAAGRVVANVRRIEHMWTDCRTRFGNGGPFLFGALRRGRRDVRPGRLPLPHLCGRGRAVARDYMEAVMALAGLGRMARGGAQGALGAAGGRGGLADRTAE